MAFRIEATIEGEKQVSAYLGIVAADVKDFRAPLEKISAEMLKTFDLNYRDSGELFGGWAPRRKEQPWPLLEKTGRMRDSFTQQVRSDTLTLGNDAPYFGYHQSNRPRTRLPRRVMMMVDSARRSFIIKTFQAHLIQAVRGGK